MATGFTPACYDAVYDDAATLAVDVAACRHADAAASLPLMPLLDYDMPY